MEEDNLKLSVFKLYIDCGRNGELEGVFVAPQEYVDIFGKNNFLAMLV